MRPMTPAQLEQEVGDSRDDRTVDGGQGRDDRSVGNDERKDERSVEGTVEPSDASRERTVELFVRSLSPGVGRDRHERVLDQIERLESRGRIDEYAVHVWGSRLDPAAATRTEVGQFIRGRVEAFCEWAAGDDRSIDPFFEPERVCSSLTGDSYTELTLPTVALAEYVGDELVFVAPCSDGDRRYTVEDRLAELETEPIVAPNGGTVPDVDDVPQGPMPSAQRSLR